MSNITENSLIWTKFPQAFPTYDLQYISSTADTMIFQSQSHSEAEPTPMPFQFKSFNLNDEEDFDLDYDVLGCYNDRTPTAEDNPCIVPSCTGCASDIFMSSNSEQEANYSAQNLQKQSKKIRKEEAQPQSKQNKPAQKESKKRSWTPEEDALALELYAIHGPRWAKLASIMKTRTRKQIRDRYLSALRPDINNGAWTQQEEKLFDALHAELGKKWAEIAARMPGRTENQVKNKFYWSKRKNATHMNTPNEALETPSVVSPVDTVNVNISHCPDFEMKNFSEESFWTFDYNLFDSSEIPFRDSFEEIDFSLMQF